MNHLRQNLLTISMPTKIKIFEIGNFYEILKYELFINNKIIVSSNEIFQEV